MATLGPRLVIAGTHSGVGKTTVATGLMAALQASDLRVAGAKIGPDFIDPSYHQLATGRPSRSLDAYLSGEDLLGGLAARAGTSADLLVIEGVMGLFDGSGQPDCDGSTAAVAHILGAPTVLVVDASAMAESVAAIVHGFSTLDARLDLAGVVLNRVGSEGHGELLREALEPLRVPVLGVIYSDESLHWRERHLGLVPVAEDPQAIRTTIVRLGALMQRSLDLESLVSIARSAKSIPVCDPPVANRTGNGRIAVCSGPAFNFNYPENLELFEQAGGELVFFDPLVSRALPEGCSGLYAGGGFPELFATQLAENKELSFAVRRRLAEGMVIWAECGGYMWLAESIDGHPMTGVLSGVRIEMREQLTIGYRSATATKGGFLGPSGTVLRGHEFHRSIANPAGEDLAMSGRFGEGRAGFVSPTLFASYLHQHLAARPELAEGFVRAVSRAKMTLAERGSTDIG